MKRQITVNGARVELESVLMPEGDFVLAHVNGELLAAVRFGDDLDDTTASEMALAAVAYRLERHRDSGSHLTVA
jgi:hypothetical protein